MKKTVVTIIKDCLDKGINSEREIFEILHSNFPEILRYKLWNRIKSTILYLNKKKLNTSEFNIEGVPLKLEHHDLLLKVLKVIKEKTDLRICKIK